jgi:hypothetical protein
MLSWRLWRFYFRHNVDSILELCEYFPLPTECSLSWLPLLLLILEALDLNLNLESPLVFLSESLGLWILSIVQNSK